jgi:regulator of sirC expression with transglutaminase-like and TPR domain
LKQFKLEAKEDYFKICENRDIIARMLRNLEVSFSKENNHSKKEQVRQLMDIMTKQN